MGSCGRIKHCIKNVFKAELTATSDGVYTATYMSHLRKDLHYAVEHSNSVATASETAFKWIEVCQPTKSSHLIGLCTFLGTVTGNTCVFINTSLPQTPTYDREKTHEMVMFVWRV